ncbi:MAG: putative molybdenum carrier protein, partial [Candidatus Omnitrophota bacterium]|nr:putative molybdenum carrier protein [Candidatus Omnitrophota bacterium]
MNNCIVILAMPEKDGLRTGWSTGIALTAPEKRPCVLFLALVAVVVLAVIFMLQVMAALAAGGKGMLAMAGFGVLGAMVIGTEGPSFNPDDGNGPKEPGVSLLGASQNNAQNNAQPELERAFDNYCQENGLMRFPMLRKFFTTPIKERLLEDKALRPVFMVPMAGRVGGLVIFDENELTQIGGRGLLNKFSVFSAGSAEQAEVIAEKGGEIIVGVVDRPSSLTLFEAGFEVIHGRQAYFPLLDGTWLEVKGCGQFRNPEEPPFWYNAHDGGRPRYEGLCLEDEAERAMRSLPKLINSNARFARLLGYRSLEYVFNGEDYLKSSEAKSLEDQSPEKLMPILVFTRLMHPHRLTKLPQLFSVDPGLEKLRARICKALGMSSADRIMSLKEFLEMIVTEMGFQEGAKQGRRFYKITIHEGDITVAGEEKDLEELCEFEEYNRFIGGGVSYKDDTDATPFFERTQLGLQGIVQKLFAIRAIFDMQYTRIPYGTYSAQVTSLQDALRLFFNAYFQDLDESSLTVWASSRIRYEAAGPVLPEVFAQLEKKIWLEVFHPAYRPGTDSHNIQQAAEVVETIILWSSRQSTQPTNPQVVREQIPTGPTGDKRAFLLVLSAAPVAAGPALTKGFWRTLREILYWISFVSGFASLTAIICFDAFALGLLFFVITFSAVAAIPLVSGALSVLWQEARRPRWGDDYFIYELHYEYEWSAIKDFAGKVAPLAWPYWRRVWAHMKFNLKNELLGGVTAMPGAAPSNAPALALRLARAQARHEEARKLHHRLLQLAYARYNNEDVDAPMRNLCRQVELSLLPDGQKSAIIAFIEGDNEPAACAILSGLSHQWKEERRDSMIELGKSEAGSAKVYEIKNGKVCVMLGRYVKHRGVTLLRRGPEARALYRWQRILDRIFVSLALNRRYLKELTRGIGGLLAIVEPRTRKQEALPEAEALALARKAASLAEGLCRVRDDDLKQSRQELETVSALAAVNTPASVRLIKECLQVSTHFLELRITAEENETGFMRVARLKLRAIGSRRVAILESFVRKLKDALVQGHINLAQALLFGLRGIPYLREPDFIGLRSLIQRSIGLARGRWTDKAQAQATQEAAFMEEIIGQAQHSEHFMAEYHDWYLDLTEAPATGSAAHAQFEQFYQQWAAKNNFVRGAPRYWRAKLFAAVFISEKSPCFSPLQTILIILRIPEFVRLFPHLKKHSYNEIVKVLNAFRQRKTPLQKITRATLVPLPDRDAFLRQLLAAAITDFKLVDKATPEEIKLMYSAFNLAPPSAPAPPAAPSKDLAFALPEVAIALGILSLAAVIALPHWWLAIAAPVAKFWPQALGVVAVIIVLILIRTLFKIAKKKISVWIENELSSVGGSGKESILQQLKTRDNEKLLDILILQLGAKIIFPTHGFAFIALALQSGDWRYALFIFADGLIRALIVILVSGFKYPLAIKLGAVPCLGNIAVLLQMAKNSRELGDYLLQNLKTGQIVRAFGISPLLLAALLRKLKLILVLLLFLLPAAGLGSSYEQFNSLPAETWSTAVAGLAPLQVFHSGLTGLVFVTGLGCVLGGIRAEVGGNRGEEKRPASFWNNGLVQIFVFSLGCGLVCLFLSQGSISFNPAILPWIVLVGGFLILTAMVVTLIWFWRSAGREAQAYIRQIQKEKLGPKGSKIRVLQVVASLSVGGLENKVLQLAKTINLDKFECLILSRDSQVKFDADIKRAKQRGAQIIFKLGRPKFWDGLSRGSLPKRAMSFSLKLLLLVRYAMVEYKLYKYVSPDIIHYRGGGGLRYLAKKIIAKLSGVPVIITTYHSFPILTREDQVKRLGLFRARLYNWAEVFSFKYLDNVLVALTEEEKQAHIARGVPESHVVVIANGIDLQPFLARPCGKQISSGMHIQDEALAALNDPHNLTIGAVGRLDPVKGFHDLIVAARAVVSKLPNARFFIIGYGEEMANLQADIQSRGLGGYVFLLGLVDHDDLSVMYGAFDMVVQPSWSEGLPTAVIEAMATARPVIASFVGGTPTVIGRAGLLVHSKNPGELASRILFLAHRPHLRERLGKLAREHAKKFNAEGMAQAYERLYESLSRRSQRDDSGAFGKYPQERGAVLTIISGGQTGADRGALEGARKAGLSTGGWAPKGYHTERGPDPTLKDFGLQAVSSYGIEGYRDRTERNIVDSDGTVIFADKPGSPGTKLAISLIAKYKKPCIINPTIPELRRFAQGKSVINVAGNRESAAPGIQKRVEAIIVEAFSKGVRRCSQGPKLQRFTKQISLEQKRGIFRRVKDLFRNPLPARWLRWLSTAFSSLRTAGLQAAPAEAIARLQVLAGNLSASLLITGLAAAGQLTITGVTQTGKFSGLGCLSGYVKDLPMRDKGYGFFGVVKDYYEALKDIFSADKIKAHAKLWRESYRGMKRYIANSYGQFMEVNRDYIAVAYNRAPLFARGIVNSQRFGFLRGKDRVERSGIKVGVNFNAREVKGDNGTGDVAVDFVGESYSTPSAHKNSCGYGTRKNKGVILGCSALALLTISLGLPSLLVNSILPSPITIYPPAYLSTIFSNSSLRNWSLLIILCLAFAVLRISSASKNKDSLFTGESQADLARRLPMVVGLGMVMFLALALAIAPSFVVGYLSAAAKPALGCALAGAWLLARPRSTDRRKARQYAKSPSNPQNQIAEVNKWLRRADNIISELKQVSAQARPEETQSLLSSLIILLRRANKAVRLWGRGPCYSVEMGGFYYLLGLQMAAQASRYRQSGNLQQAQAELKAARAALGQAAVLITNGPLPGQTIRKGLKLIISVIEAINTSGTEKPIAVPISPIDDLNLPRAVRNNFFMAVFQCGGNVIKVAELLGCASSSIYFRLKAEATNREVVIPKGVKGNA